MGTKRRATESGCGGGGGGIFWSVKERKGSSLGCASYTELSIIFIDSVYFLVLCIIFSLRISVIFSSFLSEQCGMFFRGVIEEICIKSYSSFGLSF